MTCIFHADKLLAIVERWQRIQFVQQPLGFKPPLGDRRVCVQARIVNTTSRCTASDGHRVIVRVVVHSPAGPDASGCAALCGAQSQFGLCNIYYHFICKSSSSTTTQRRRQIICVFDHQNGIVLCRLMNIYALYDH